jgi:hypothetical protein
MRRQLRWVGHFNRVLIATWLCGVPSILVWNSLNSVRVVNVWERRESFVDVRWERDGGVRPYVAFCCGHEVDACVRSVFFVDIRVLSTNCCGLPPSQLLPTSVASLVTSQGIVVWFCAWVRNYFSLRIPQTGRGARPACYPYSTGTDRYFVLLDSGRSMQQFSHFYLV